MTLTVDTSTRAFSLSLFQEDELAHIELCKELAHSQQVVRVCQFMLERMDLAIDQIEAAYAGIGPGSFTGVRNRTKDSAPNRPRDRGIEVWMPRNKAVIAGPPTIKVLCTPAPMCFDP